MKNIKFMQLNPYETNYCERHDTVFNVRLGCEACKGEYEDHEVDLFLGKQRYKIQKRENKTMTKKDYEFAANQIHEYLQRGEVNGSIAVPSEVFNSWVDIFCTVFSADNPKFNEQKFKEACYEGKHIRKSIKG